MKSICLWLSLVFIEGSASAQLPALSISRLSSAIVQLSWPANFTDWHLTTTTNLTPPRTWESVPDTAVLQAGAIVVDYLIGEEPRFFRLEQGVAGCVFHATPPVIQPGGSSILSWCRVSGTIYQLLPGPGTVAGSNYVVSPSITTVYSLIASNADGVTSYPATVTVTSGGGCDFASVTNWNCTLSFSYELTPSSADYSFIVRHDGHLSIHLTPLVIAPPFLMEWSGFATGNLQLNDRMEDLTGAPPAVTTLIGSGAPPSTVLDLKIDCARHTYSFRTEPGVSAVLANPAGSTSYLSPLCTIYVNDRPLPSALGTLSGSEFLSARGPGWNGAGDFYFLAGEVLAERMFITGLVNDDTAGSASVIWSFAPIP